MDGGDENKRSLIGPLERAQALEAAGNVQCSYATNLMHPWRKGNWELSPAFEALLCLRSGRIHISSWCCYGGPASLGAILSSGIRFCFHRLLEHDLWWTCEWPMPDDGYERGKVSGSVPGPKDIVQCEN